MKKFISLLIITLAICLPFQESQAQPQKIGTSTYYEIADTDQSLARLKYNYFGNSTVFTVGVYFTKGAQQDSASRIMIYHALDETVLDDMQGVKLDSLAYTFSGAEEYKEETITLSSGIGYLDFYYDGSATATDTFRIAPKIFIKPK